MDKEILRHYMFGFNDELNGELEEKFNDELLQKAYNMGRIDALIGDDISSVDNQTEEEIIKRIKGILEYKCVCCNKPIKELNRGLSDGGGGIYEYGIVQKISAGYGSTLDGNVYLLAICDDCTKKKVEEGVLIYRGNFF